MASKNPLHPIPHPPRKPFIGNILTLSGDAPLQDLMKLAQELGPIYWLDMMGRPVIVVSSFALVDEVCDETRFDKSTRGFLRRLRPLAHGLFTSDTQEPDWSKSHNILLPTFAQRAMQGYHGAMLDIAEQLMLKWERLNPNDEIDVTDDMTRLTLDTIGLCGFDYRFNSFYRDGNHPFVDAMVGSLETTMHTRGLPFEQLINKKEYQQHRANIRFMHGMVEDVIKERRLDGGDGKKNDLLNYMLNGVDKKTGQRLDDRNIRDETITFLIAGHETTSGLLSFATYALLNHPDVLQKAYAEVDRVLGPDPSVKPTYAQVNKLTYISQILQETLAAVADRARVRYLSAEGDGDRREIPAQAEASPGRARADAPPRQGGVGRPAGALRSRQLLARGAGEAPGQRLQAVRQRSARLHRPPVRHAGGGAGAWAWCCSASS